MYNALGAQLISFIHSFIHRSNLYANKIVLPSKKVAS